MILPVTQFTYNTIPQKGIGTLPFKANYGYKLRTLITLRQAKRACLKAKERIEKLMDIYKGLCKTAKIIQERMKKYYNLKRSEGPDLEKGSKAWLIYKNLISR